MSVENPFDNPFENKQEVNETDFPKKKEKLMGTQVMLLVAAFIFIIGGIGILISASWNIIPDIIKIILMTIVGVTAVAISVWKYSYKLRFIWSTIILCGVYSVLLSGIKTIDINNYAGLIYSIILMIGYTVFIYKKHKVISNTYFDIFSTIVIGVLILTLYNKYNFNETFKIVLLNLLIIGVVLIQAVTALKTKSIRTILLLIGVYTNYILGSAPYWKNTGDRFNSNSFTFANWEYTAMFIGVVILIVCMTKIYSNNIKVKHIDTIYIISTSLSFVYLTGSGDYLFNSLLGIITLILVMKLLIRYISISKCLAILVIPLAIVLAVFTNIMFGFYSIGMSIVVIAFIIDYIANNDTKRNITDIIVTILMFINILSIYNEQDTINIFIILSLVAIGIFIVYKLHTEVLNWKNYTLIVIQHIEGMALSILSGRVIADIISMGSKELYDYLMYFTLITFVIWLGVWLYNQLNISNNSMLVCILNIGVYLINSIVLIILFLELEMTFYNPKLNDIHTIIVTIAAIIGLIINQRTLYKINPNIEAVMSGLGFIQLLLVVIVGLNDFSFGNTMLSIAIAMYGIYFIIRGLKRSNKLLRIIGLLYLVISEIKICILDTWEGNTIIRAIAFIMCGILCILTSILYAKVSTQYKKEDTNNPFN